MRQEQNENHISQKQQHAGQMHDPGPQAPSPGIHRPGQQPAQPGQFAAIAFKPVFTPKYWLFGHFPLSYVEFSNNDNPESVSRAIPI
jgi:hypothetical protein